jgi:hypothetical protein
MRKNLFFWLTVIVVATVITGGFLYFGRKPVTETVTEALPLVSEGVPHALLTAQGNQIKNRLPETLAEEASPRAKPYVHLMERMILPLAGLSEETALLATWAEQGNRADLYGAFLFSRENVSMLSSGKIPEEWKDVLPEVSVKKAGEKGRYRLVTAAGAPPMHLETVDRLVLLSLYESGLERMHEALKNPEMRSKIFWTLEGDWPGHMYLHDGGSLAASAAMQGRNVGNDPVKMEMAWRQETGEGLLAWTVSGLEGWIPDTIRNNLAGYGWSEKLFVPDPLIAATGFNLPSGFSAAREISSELPEAAEALGVRTELLEKVLEGPLIVTIGGQSRFLMMNLPGFLVEMPDRGAPGMELVEGIWDRHWMRLSLTPKPLEGFKAGGSLSVPLTVVGAASEDLAVLGAMDEAGLKKRVPLREVIDLPEKALGWMYVDFPKAADALENMARVGSLAQRVGLSGGDDLEDIATAAEELRRLGKLMIVIEDYKNGRISWEQVPQVEE